jgi:hypothetical protein
VNVARKRHHAWGERVKRRAAFLPQKPREFDKTRRNDAGRAAALTASIGQAGSSSAQLAVGGTHCLHDLVEHSCADYRGVFVALLPSGLSITGMNLRVRLDSAPQQCGPCRGIFVCMLNAGYCRPPRLWNKARETGRPAAFQCLKLLAFTFAPAYDAGLPTCASVLPVTEMEDAKCCRISS